MPGVGLEHDECVVAGAAREVAFEEVERLLRLGVRDAEVVAELPVEDARERDDRDRHDDPHADEPPTMAHRAPPQAFEQTRHLVPLVFRRPLAPMPLVSAHPGAGLIRNPVGCRATMGRCPSSSSMSRPAAGCSGRTGGCTSATSTRRPGCGSTPSPATCRTSPPTTPTTPGSPMAAASGSSARPTSRSCARPGTTSRSS